MRVDNFLIENQIRLQLWQTVFEPEMGTVEAIIEAIEEENQNRRIPELADVLNPYLLDAEKVKQFLEGLTTLPEETITALQGKNLYLNTPELALHPTSALTIENLKTGYTLEIIDDSELVQPTLHTQFDLTHARTLVNRAREATQTFHTEVEQLENKLNLSEKYSDEFKEIQSQLFDARSKRHSAAIVWRENSTRLAEELPDDNQWQQEEETATQAASDYSMPPRSGMPQVPG